MRSVSVANRQKQEKGQRNLAQAGRQVRIAGAFLLLIMLLLLSLIWSICSGSVSVPIMEFLQELREPKLRGMAWTIIWEIRLPRALAALILGGALALSGYLLQTFFHNPIAGPSGMEYYDQFGDAGGSGICRSASLYAVCAPGRAENGTDGNADRRGRDDRLYLLGNHGFCCDLRQRCGYCQPA